MNLYRVKHWEDHFENNRTRQIECCTHVWVPNKQHGLGFTFILSQPDGACILGIWYLIIEACSLQKLPRQGFLTDTGTSVGRQWNVTTMTLRWRRTPDEIQRALAVLSSEDVDWLEVVEVGVSRASVGRQSAAPSLPLIQEQKLQTGTDTVTGGGPTPDEFELFWNAYPKRKSKQPTMLAWAQNNPSRPSTPELLAIIEKQKTWEDWKKDNGRFIPYPENYLLQARWTDEDYSNVPKSDESTGSGAIDCNER